MSHGITMQHNQPDKAGSIFFGRFQYMIVLMAAEVVNMTYAMMIHSFDGRI
jgi:hypothetical protein